MRLVKALMRIGSSIARFAKPDRPRLTHGSTFELQMRLAGEICNRRRSALRKFAR